MCASIFTRFINGSSIACWLVSCYFSLFFYSYEMRLATDLSKMSLILLIMTNPLWVTKNLLFRVAKSVFLLPDIIRHSHDRITKKQLWSIVRDALFCCFSPTKKIPGKRWSGCRFLLLWWAALPVSLHQQLWLKIGWLFILKGVGVSIDLEHLIHLFYGLFDRALRQVHCTASDKLSVSYYLYEDKNEGICKFS